MELNIKIDWLEINKIKEIISKSTSKKEVLHRMGFSKSDGRQHKKLQLFISQYDIDISHFGYIPENWKKLPEIISQCYCYADVLRMLGLSTHGSNNKTVKKYVKQFNLDISHFLPTNVGKNIIRLADEEVFCVNTQIDKSTVRKRFLKVIDYKCSECGIFEWNGKPLILEMDHIDGNRNNHTLNNLRLLCPNCHSQTNTFGSKNKNIYSAVPHNIGNDLLLG